MRRGIYLAVMVALLAAAPGWAGKAPIAVSPGSDTGSLIESRCPTFSWGAISGAKSYELVVYRVGEEHNEEPVVRQTVAGSALSWTPSLEWCLTRGGKYAWSVRVGGEEAASDWSPPSLFQVASGTSAEELEAALQVVRRYLATTGSVRRPSELAAGSRPEKVSMIEAHGPTSALPGPTDRELTVEGTMGANLVVGETLLGNTTFSYLLHLYPLSSSYEACEEDSDRGGMFVLGKGDESQADDGICVCVRKWFNNQWNYVFQALGPGNCG